MRACLIVPTEMVAKRAADGSFYASGLGGDRVTEIIVMLSRLFGNDSTFELTTENSVCADRMMRNVSDFATTMRSYYDNLPEQFIVPVPMFIHKIGMLSGYNYTHFIGQHRTVSVMENFASFHHSVYLWTFLLLVSFFLCIVLKVFIDYFVALRIPVCEMKTREITRLVSYFTTQVIKLRSTHFRWIQLLYLLLVFFLLAAFIILYKTKQVIADAPFVIDSYKTLLEHESTIPGFYDSFTEVTEEFKNSPRQAVKGRIWRRLLGTRRQNDYIIRGGRLDPDFIMRIRDLMINGSRGEFVMLLSQITAPFILSLSCSLSEESELWRLKVYYDSMETENLLGYVILKSYHNRPMFISQMMKLFDYGIILQYYRRVFAAAEFGYQVTGSSPKHRQAQSLLCDISNKMVESMDTTTVASLDYSFYASFFQLIIISLGLSLFLLICEILYARCSHRKYPRRQRNRKVNAVRHVRPLQAPTETMIILGFNRPRQPFPYTVNY